MGTIVNQTLTLPSAARLWPADQPPRRFLGVKRIVDLAVAVALLPVLGCLAGLIFLINLRFNPGPLVFRQQRMGEGCRPFTIVKFRTMLPAAPRERRFDEPVEVDRITPFGALMRRTRVDELPQILNIIAGEMSVVGPRPDLFDHAAVFAEMVPGYRERHRVRPGLTGLAQIRVGYAEGLEATRVKVATDLAYIRNMSAALDVVILAGTVRVILSGRGAR